MLFQDLKLELLQKKEGYELKSSAFLSLILHKLIYEKKQSDVNLHVELIKNISLKITNKIYPLQLSLRRSVFHLVIAGRCLRRLKIVLFWNF